MKDITREDFADFVKRMRITAGLDQETLASLLDVKLSVIQRFETCKGVPDDPYAFEYDLRQVIKQEIEFKKMLNSF